MSNSIDSQSHTSCYRTIDCANREMCYGCCNCEPQYWKQYFPDVYNAFKQGESSELKQGILTNKSKLS